MAICHLQLCTRAISLIKKFRAFLIQETINALFKSSQVFYYPFLCLCAFKNWEKQRNISILLTGQATAH